LRWLKINLINGKTKQGDRFLCLICAGLFILCLECGKKGPPVAPKAIVPPAVQDLEAEVIRDRVRLTWSVPKKGDTLFDGLTHFGVYRYESHSSAEVCPGCPIPFEQFLDIKLDDPEPARLEGDRMILHDAIEADYRYAYKVVIYHRSGAVSKDSNIVQFVVGPNFGAPSRSQLE
jgi:hypothetical protein